MYQGSNKTALSSQRQIAEALFALLRQQDFGRISVCSICREAQVSRQTFYSLFRSKENVLSYILQSECSYTPADPSGPDALRQLCRGFGAFLRSRAEVLRLLPADYVPTLLHGTFYDSLSGCGCVTERIAPSLRPYAADFLAAALSSVAATWLSRPEQQPEPEEIAYTLLRGALFGD